MYGQNPLMLPPISEGNSINLMIQNGSHEFFEGISTETAGCNGPILGPTIILNQGDEVQFNVTNELMDTTTMHWHGMHVASMHDGGPHNKIAPGETWSPQFEILDHAGTYWYHPHLHMMTNTHVSKGVSGMIWVRDEMEQSLNLPNTYGVDEWPLIIQTKAFDEAGQIVPDSNTDDQAMVNATVDPIANIPAQFIRLHFLNGASQRVFNLGLEDNLPFYLIGSEGGLMSTPLELLRLRLSPGERAEIMLDASSFEGDTLIWKSFASEFSNGTFGATNPGMGSGMTMNGYTPNALNGSDFTLLQMAVGPATENGIFTLPTSLDPNNVNPWNEAEVNATRTITMTPQSMGMNALNGNFLLNGAAFNMDVINYTIPLGNLEIWNIVNSSPIGHPFHIHDVQFYLLDRNGVPPAPEESGRKDVIYVPAMTSARFITAFEDFADSETPYMYHCHMLTHEDGGMMGQFVVVDETSTSSLDELELPLPFPVPANHSITLSHPGGPWSIIDNAGRLVSTGNTLSKQFTVSTVDWSEGLYFFISHEKNHQQRFSVLH